MRARYPRIETRRARRRPVALRLITEAVANWLTRPLLGGGLTVMLAAALLGVTVAESNAVTDVRRYEDDLIATGYATMFVQPGPQALSALTTDDCAAIGSLRGVRASFAIVDQTTQRRWSVAGPNVPALTATGDVVDYFSNVEPVQMQRWRTAQAFVDPASAAAAAHDNEYLLRLVPPRPGGDRTSNSAGPTEDGAATAHPAAPTMVTALGMPLTSLGTGSIGLTLLTTHTSGSAQSCVLFVDPDTRPAASAAVETALPPTSGFSQQWALPGADNLDTPRQRFEQRPSQYYWLGGVVVFTALWITQLRIRRSDHALYAVVGLRTPSITTMIIIELAITVMLAACLATAIIALATATHAGTYTSLDVGADSARRALLGAGSCAAASSWYHARSVTSSTLNALKDR